MRKSEALFCDFNTNLSEVTFPKIIASMIYQYDIPGDPPLIAPTIAPFQSPPTSVLVAEMKTRFTLIEPSWHLLVEIK